VIPRTQSRDKSLWKTYAVPSAIQLTVLKLRMMISTSRRANNIGLPVLSPSATVHSSVPLDKDAVNPAKMCVAAK
jgi:hypothetical protein